MAKRVVTLEINSTTIKLMEASGGKVLKWASLALEPGVVEGGVISDLKALGAAVKELMESSDIKGKSVIASISGLYSTNRILMTSELPGGVATPEAVLEAAGEITPLATDQLYLSWQTITTGEEEQQVLIVGVPRDVIDTEVQALKTAGINPRMLDFKAIALARATNKEQALILNIEPSSFDIIIIVNGIPEIMRTIAWQQDDLTAEDKTEHLAVTLELTVGFYNSRNPGNPLDPATPLFITGQMSGDVTLVEKLQARVAYPVEPLAPPLEYPAHLPTSQYAVNIGLTLKGMPPPKNPEQGGYSLPDINFLPEAYRPWKPSAKQLYRFSAIMVAIALLFPLFQITTDARSETAILEARQAALSNELQRMQLEIKNREPLKQAINDYHIIVNMGGGFTEDMAVINNEAEKLGVQVKSIAHEGESITIAWQADSYTAFDSYLTALEESGRFSSPIPRPDTGYPFTTSGSIKLELTAG